MELSEGEWQWWKEAHGDWFVPQWLACTTLQVIPSTSLTPFGRVQTSRQSKNNFFYFSKSKRSTGRHSCRKNWWKSTCGGNKYPLMEVFLAVARMCDDCASKMAPNTCHPRCWHKLYSRKYSKHCGNLISILTFIYKKIIIMKKGNHYWGDLAVYMHTCTGTCVHKHTNNTHTHTASVVRYSMELSEPSVSYRGCRGRGRSPNRSTEVVWTLRASALMEAAICWTSLGLCQTTQDIITPPQTL